MLYSTKDDALYAIQSDGSYPNEVFEIDATQAGMDHVFTPDKSVWIDALLRSGRYAKATPGTTITTASHRR